MRWCSWCSLMSTHAALKQQETARLPAPFCEQAANRWILASVRDVVAVRASPLSIISLLLPTHIPTGILRTPEERFVGLPGFPFKPHYGHVDAGFCPGALLRVHYLDEGRRDATETVLLMHGEPSWCYLYRHMIPPLVAGTHRVRTLFGPNKGLRLHPGRLVRTLCCKPLCGNVHVLIKVTQFGAACGRAWWRRGCADRSGVPRDRS